MRFLLGLVLIWGIGTYVCNAEITSVLQPEKNLSVDKVIELAGLVSNGKMNDAIGIETLQDIVTPLIGLESTAPNSMILKLGVSEDCQCAQLRLFRISKKAGEKPVQINNDAIRGFSKKTKTVNIILEVTADSKLYLKAKVAEKLDAGKSFEWVAAEKIKRVSKIVPNAKPVSSPGK